MSLGSTLEPLLTGRLRWNAASNNQGAVQSMNPSVADDIFFVKALKGSYTN